MRVAFVRASNENVYFGELIDAVCGALGRRGVETEEIYDHFPAPSRDLVTVFVPHEFTGWTEHPAWPRAEHLARSVAICTEQPSSVWYAAARDLARAAGAVVDISPLGVVALENDGITAAHLELGYVPEWDSWGGRVGERPVDLVFLGGITPRRERVLSRLAPTLSDARCEIRLFDRFSPLSEGSTGHVTRSAKWELLRSAKTFLHLHRDVDPYFERLRAFGAFANGCLLVTEHADGAGGLEPGEHFVCTSAESLPVVLPRLLADPEGIEAIARRAYDHARGELHIDRNVEVLLDAIETASRRPAQGARATVPSPFSPPDPPSAYAAVVATTPHDQPVRSALRAVLMQVRGLERRLAADSTVPELAEERYGRPCAAPRASVILTVYNYARHVEAAIRSVALSDEAEVELIVVDDASTDGSPDVVREALRDAPWLDATLIARSRNAGLPAARNLAWSRARAPYVFVLDADNEVYPRCLGALADALDADSEAAVAYPILERFGIDGPIGLVSAFPWSAERLRWQGNYIDAMAMLRRSVLEELGGYTSDGRLFGWEDFALWCAIVDAGGRGVLVPEILARYRVAPGSMISVTNLDPLQGWNALIERYSFLSETQRFPG